MQIKLSKSSLAEALNSVGTVVASKSSLPILSNVKISAKDGKATFVCSDLDTTLIYQIDCEVIGEGETTIPVKTFSAAVSKVVEGDVNIEVSASDVATMMAGTSKFKFKGLPAREFPVLPPRGEDVTSVSFDSASLREMLRKTAFAMCADETRVALNSVLLDFSQGGGHARAVATDGRRLAMLDCDISVPEGFNKTYVIPRKAVDILGKKIPKEGSCIIEENGSQLRLAFGNLVLFTKLIEQPYPNYKQVVPANSNINAVIDRIELVGALDRVSVFTMTDTPRVSMTFADNKLVLNSDETDYGNSMDEMPIKYDGEKIVMCFNPAYLRDALNVIDEDEIEIALINSSAPVVVRKAGSDDYKYVVMPLRN